MTSTQLKVLKVLVAGMLIGLLIAVLFRGPSPLYLYSKWRVGKVMGKGVFPIAINNIAVVFLTLFGGILFSLLEIKSYKSFPRGMYNLLDRLSTPLHYIFSIFDKKIKNLENPMKSCYFISVAFPVGVLFINTLLFSYLILYGVLRYGIDEQMLSAITSVSLIGVLEFFCIIIAVIPAYNFTQRNFSLYASNDIEAFIKISNSYLRSSRNWLIIIIVSLILIASAFLEQSIIAP